MHEKDRFLKFYPIVLVLVPVMFFVVFAVNKLPKEVAETPQYISVESGGQLGNQMFHIATALAYAWDHGLKAVFPVLNQSVNNMAYNRDHLFFRLDASDSPVPLKRYYVGQPNFVDLPKNLKNVVLEGGFFSWKFFDHRREKILGAFAPSEEITNRLYQKYGKLISLDNTVSVHVRTYSKKIHEEGLHFVGFKYFEEAMNIFPQHSVFVIFSDRIEWCKEKFGQLYPDKNFVFIEGNDHIEDLFLMSLMKHQILSKSTFSWWGAYLNVNPNKVVCAPIKKRLNLPSWITQTVKTVVAWVGIYLWSNEDYYLPDWKILYYELEPYPEDIKDYYSQSVDPRERASV